MYRRDPKAMAALKEFLKEKERKRKEEEKQKASSEELDLDSKDSDEITGSTSISSDSSLDSEEEIEAIEANFYNDGPFNLYITHSQLPDSGLGVYTQDFIPEDTIIGEYRGEIVKSYNLETNDYFYELAEADEANGIMGVGIDSSKLPRCYMAMINDAQFSKTYSNNCVFEGDVDEQKVYVVSTRDIEPEEELFVSYGEGYWNPPESNDPNTLSDANSEESRKVKVKAKLEIADHDGYCSGGECEYSCSIKEYIIDAPYYTPNDTSDLNLQYLIDLLPEPKIDTWGSGYCDLSDECKLNDLYKHSHKYTILEVTVLG